MKNNAVADKFRDEGNAFFSQVNFYEALISYNQSLCHAEPQSVQLGLAYSNRSAVYLNLKEFDKCLANIQLARDNNYPYEGKLKTREEKCKEKMKTHQPDTKNDPWKYFKLSYPPNEKIPYLADCVELKTSEKFGRHIIANRELKAGDVIAIEPIVFPIVAKSGIYQRCTSCLSSNMLNLIPCYCLSAMFCDQECLTKGRDRFHGALCKHIDSAYERFDEDRVLTTTLISRGLLESLLTVERPEKLRDLMSSTNPTTIFDYDLSGQQNDPDIDFKYLSIVNNLGVHFASSFIEDLEAKLKVISSDCVETFFQPQAPEAKATLLEYSTNLAMISAQHSIDVLISELRPSQGNAIFPIRSLYSHSCDANTYVFTIDNKLVHIVMKPIRKGEQLFITYGSLDFVLEPNRAIRQECLMELSNFKCLCPACLNDYSVESLPRCDPTLRHPTREDSSTIDGLMKELQKRFDYIQKNFKNYPSYEVAATENCAKILIADIVMKSFWPFEMIN